MSGGDDSAKNFNAPDASGVPQNTGAQLSQLQRMRRNWGTIAVRAVVILLCICVVAALLPLLNTAREDGRRTVCQNNIRNLGLAIASYESQRRAYPGYRNAITVNKPINVAGVTTDKVPVNW